MKIRSTILTASAILVLAATGAGAASSMIPRDPGSDGGPRTVQKSGKSAVRHSPSNSTLLAQNKALKAANKALASRNKALVAGNDSLSSENQALRVENAQLWARIHVIDPPTDTGKDNSCEAYMVDCTAQEECDTWGYNCDLVVYPPVDSTQVESSSGGNEGQA